MKNIMKSIVYDIGRNKLMLRIYILMIAVMGLTTVLNLNVNEGLTGASGMLADNPSISYEFSIFILALVVGTICGSDFKDKVANYEIMSGHSRLSIFLARSLMAIITAGILSTILSFVPILVGSVISGWGDTLDMGNVIVRHILLIFPYMRLAAFLVVVTYLVKSQYIMMAAGFILMMALLFKLPDIEKKNASNKWRILYAVPVFLVLVYVVLNGHDSYHILIYLAAALQLVCLFLTKAGAKRIMAAVSAALLAATLVIVSASSGYNRKPYYNDFQEAFSTMREHYILTDEKGIDWDKLGRKYKPLFRESDRTQDYVENYKNWLRFTGEFYDGHVSYQMRDDSEFLDAVMRSFGNDYGLSLSRLSTGEIVAVNVEGYDNSYSIDSARKWRRRYRYIYGSRWKNAF